MKFTDGIIILLLVSIAMFVAGILVGGSTHRKMAIEDYLNGKLVIQVQTNSINTTNFIVTNIIEIK